MSLDSITWNTIHEIDGIVNQTESMFGHFTTDVVYPVALNTPPLSNWRLMDLRWIET